MLRALQSLTDVFVVVLCNIHILLTPNERTSITLLGGKLDAFTFTMERTINIILYPHNNLLPVGLIAQLVEHCTSIVEVRVQIPV